jgi:hypothetical protein
MPSLVIECLVQNLKQQLQSNIAGPAWRTRSHRTPPWVSPHQLDRLAEALKAKPFPTVITQPAGLASFAKRRARSNRKASVSDERLAPNLRPRPASHPVLRGDPANHAPP